jgi:hypothetical protein
VEFHSPPTPGWQRTRAGRHGRGIRHIAFLVEDIDAVIAGVRARGAELVGELERYRDVYGCATSRGQEGIIIELAEQGTSLSGAGGGSFIATPPRFVLSRPRCALRWRDTIISPTGPTGRMCEAGDREPT